MVTSIRVLVLALVTTGTPVFGQFVVSDDLNRFGIDDFEITPDGRFAVGRENTQQTAVLIYDLANGGPPVRHEANANQIGGAAQDSVAVTNERAFMLGSQLLVVDLTTPGTPLLAQHDVGSHARDLALTPNGLLLVVRGGHTAPGNPGGQFVFDVATGNPLASHPGEPGFYFQNQYPFDVDSVVASDRWAVVTSFIDNQPSGYATRVTVWDLQPVTGPPVVVFETSAADDLDGVPHDLAMAPSGDFVAVRSEFEVGYVDLTGPVPTLGWALPLFNYLGNSAMDSIEVTDTRIATLSRWSSGAVGAQLDVFEPSGAQYYQLLSGDPHDLTFTPSGEKLVARTSSHVTLYDLVSLPVGSQQLTSLDTQALPSTHTSYGAGLDSIVATDERAVACARSGETTLIYVYDISNGLLETKLFHTMPARPIDLDLSADGNTAWISGFTRVVGIDLRVNTVILDHAPTSGGGYPWCDGIAVGEQSVVAYGYTFNGPAGSPLPIMSGWISILDAFSEPVAFCATAPNSSGTTTELFAIGSARASANDLELWVAGAPRGVLGRFYYGNVAQQPTPFGDGFQCVGGQVAYFPVVRVNPNGSALQVVDALALPAGGGALLPGTTWYFQFIHRDSNAFGAGWNLSQALEITFEN